MTAHIPSTVPPPSVIALSGISLAFGGLDVLRDVHLAIRPGEINALIGPNGAGKSSLLNVMSGFYRAQRGVVMLHGDVFKRLRPGDAARQGIVRTFQNLALFGGMSVIDNVLAGRALKLRTSWPQHLFRLPKAVREEQGHRRRAEEILDFLQLGRFRDTPVATLPYGVQKRTELARALAAEPHVLLLDEPLAGMNAAEKEEMAAAIRTVNQTLGITVVLIEHDIGIVMRLADRVMVLDCGQLIADGLPDAVANDPAVIAAYLGTRH